MKTDIHDPVQLKKKQRQTWDAAAFGWHKWWFLFQQTQPINDRLIEITGIGYGDRVLDIATGLGEPALTVAQHVGNAGQVTATDLSPEMITIAKQRAAEQELENIEFKVVDTDALNFPESSFDAALCRWGLQFVNDLPTVLKQVKKSLVPGGSFASAIFGEPPKVPIISLPGRVLQEKFDVAPPVETPGPLTLAGGAQLEQALRESSFHSVRTERISISYQLPSLESYSEFIQDVIKPVAALINARPLEQQEAIWVAITKAAQQFLTSDGGLKFPFEDVLVVAQK